MQLPLRDPDTLFEELLQDRPPATMQMARDFKAFVRTKKRFCRNFYLRRFEVSSSSLSNRAS